MTTSDHQFEFLKDVAILIDYIVNVKKYKITGGRLLDTVANQKIKFDAGLSQTMKSNHLKALAIDFNFFINGHYDMSKENLIEIGVFWENLNPLNRWGGFFSGYGKNGDSGHFERNV